LFKIFSKVHNLRLITVQKNKIPTPLEAETAVKSGNVFLDYLENFLP